MKVAVDAMKGAVELQNALTGTFAAVWNKEVFHQMMAERVSKFTLQSIASAKSSAVYHWDFDAPKQVQQSDRKKNFRKKMAKHYSSFKKPDLCQCQISREWGDGSQVAACHLLKHATAEHLKEQFEINDIDDPKNVLMLCKGIETAFESGRIYFVQGSTDREYYMRAWDPVVMEEAIYGGASKKIGAFVNKILFLPRNVDPPFKRILNDHAQRSYNYALKLEWITEKVARPVEYGSPLKDNLLSITKMEAESPSVAS